MPDKHSQSGFITMIVLLVFIVAAVLFIAFKRVMSVQHQ